MDKIKLSDATGLEVYCTRPDFNYDCNITPNNCTECQLMRFHCHDLIHNTLTTEDAAVLSERVEQTGIFSGKYDGADNLPHEIWSLIHDIRQTYYDAWRRQRNDQYFLESANERFHQWFAKHGFYKGRKAGRAALYITLNEIYAGRWIVLDRNGTGGYPILQEDSGFYIPMLYDDAGDGIAYLTQLMKNEMEALGLNPDDCGFKLRHHQLAYDHSFQTIRLTGSYSFYPDPLSASESRRRRFAEQEEKANTVEYCLYKIDPQWASTYRSRYLDKLIERMPDIKLEFTDDLYPQDPNHPIHEENRLVKEYFGEDDEYDDDWDDDYDEDLDD